MPSQIAQASSQDLILGHNDTAECQKVSTDAVGIGFCRGDTHLPDHIREFWIRWFGRRVERSMQRYEETGCFGHRGEADGWRLRMEALIKGCSAAQVAKLEAARGLA